MLLITDERLYLFGKPQLSLDRLLRALLHSEFAELILVIGKRAHHDLGVIVLRHRGEVFPKLFVDVRVVLR